MLSVLYTIGFVAATSTTLNSSNLPLLHLDSQPLFCTLDFLTGWIFSKLPTHTFLSLSVGLFMTTGMQALFEGRQQEARIKDVLKNSRRRVNLLESTDPG